MTDEQIQAVFLAMLGILPRVADLEVIRHVALAGRGDLTEEIVAEYLWDHWMCEPEAPSQEQVLELVKDAKRYLITETEDALYLTCPDCGADNRGAGMIHHHQTCKPGECERWLAFYSEGISD